MRQHVAERPVAHPAAERLIAEPELMLDHVVGIKRERQRDQYVEQHHDAEQREEPQHRLLAGERSENWRARHRAAGRTRTPSGPGRRGRSPYRQSCRRARYCCTAWPPPAVRAFALREHRSRCWQFDGGQLIGTASCVGRSGKRDLVGIVHLVEETGFAPSNAAFSTRRKHRPASARVWPAAWRRLPAAMSVADSITSLVKSATLASKFDCRRMQYWQAIGSRKPYPDYHAANPPRIP